MTEHEEYRKIIQSRFGHEKSICYEKRGYYDSILLGPQQYLVESSMLTYVKKHPKATLEEVFRFFDQIAPDGLAPGDSGKDL